MFRIPLHIAILLLACSSLSWSVDDRADVLEVFSDVTLDPQRTDRDQEVGRHGRWPGRMADRLNRSGY